MPEDFVAQGFWRRRWQFLPSLSAIFVDHRHSYEGFVRIVVIAVFLLLSHLVALAIGGVAHHWSLAALGIGLSIIAAVVGAAVEGLDWRPGVVVLVLLLLTLLLVTA